VAARHSEEVKVPRIPSAESITRRIPEGSPGVVRVDTRDATAGYRELAGALKGIGEQNIAYEYSTAEANFLTLKSQKDREAVQDKDYKTLDERYTSELSTGIDEYALSISSPKARAEFIRNSKLRLEQSRGKIQGYALVKETDHERSSVNEQLNNLREVTLTGTPEEVSEARTAASNLLDSADRYYSEVEIGNMKTAWRNDAAIGRLEMMAPEDRLDALKQSWAEDLPSDVRAKLTRQAEDASLEGKSLGNVDDYVNSGLTEIEANDKAGEIKDPDLRLLTEKRIDYKYAEMRTEHTLGQKELFDKYQSSMDDPDDNMGFADIPVEERNAMDVATRDSLRAIEANTYKPRAVSDTQALIDVANMKQEGKFQDIINKVTQDADLFSKKDRESLVQIAIDGSMPIDVDDGLSDIQVIAGKITDVGITDENAKSQILNNVGEWRRKYIAKNNKAPDDQERSDFIDKQFMNVTTDYGLIWDTHEKLYTLSEENWKDVINEMVEENADAANKAAAYFKDKGITNPDRADVVRIFEYLKGKE